LLDDYQVSIPAGTMEVVGEVKVELEVAILMVFYHSVGGMIQDDDVNGWKTLGTRHFVSLHGSLL